MPRRSKHPADLQDVNTNSGPAFSRFALLPQEVQDIIWKEAIRSIGPRIVEVKTRQGNHLRKRQFTSTCPIPNVLHVCRNSREQALRRWILSFAIYDQSAQIFFDFSLDTLYFGENFGNMEQFTEGVKAEERKRIYRIAFHLLQQHDNEYFQNYIDLAHVLEADFPNLTHLICPTLGRPRPVPDPNKTAITFYYAHQDDAIPENEEFTLYNLEEYRDDIGWRHVEVVFAIVRRSIPGRLEEDERKFFGCMHCKYWELKGFTSRHVHHIPLVL